MIRLVDVGGDAKLVTGTDNDFESLTLNADLFFMETEKGDELPNAIGAAIAQVGGEIDRVFSYESEGRENAIDQAKKEAIAKAIDAGAEAESVDIIEVEEIPLAYLPGAACRVRVKAVGDLAGG